MIKRLTAWFPAALAFALLATGFASAAACDSVTKNYVVPAGELGFLVLGSDPMADINASCADGQYGAGGNCFKVTTGTLNLVVTDQTGMHVAGSFRFDDVAGPMTKQTEFCAPVKNFSVPDGAVWLKVWIKLDPQSATCGPLSPATTGTITASGTAISGVRATQSAKAPAVATGRAGTVISTSRGTSPGHFMARARPTGRARLL